MALIVATVAVYAPVREFDYVSWDDPIYVSANPHVTAGLRVEGIRWAFTTGNGGFWLPLIWLSYMLDVQLFGTGAGGHHVVNLLFHLANTILLFGLLHRLTGALGRSAFIAGLFALHPLHVESVAWVTERKDMLSTFFWMLVTWAYVGWVRTPSRWRYAAALLLFTLGLMAKPMLVTLPITLLLLDFWPLGRVAPGTGPSPRAVWIGLVREKLPMFAISLAAGIVSVVAQRSVGAVGGLTALPVPYRIGNAFLSYVIYIGQMLWPFRLAAFYPFPRGLVMSGWSVSGAILALATITYLVVRAARRYPYLPMGWLWYLVTLIPVIGLLQVGGQARADRFTYVPLIGLFVMIAFGIPDLFHGWPARTVPLAAAAGIILAACAVIASDQVQYWRNSISLWNRAVAVTADNAFVRNSLSRALLGEGRYDEAVVQHTRALQLSPDDPVEQNDFANDLAHHGKVAEAIVHYTEALRLKPNYPEAHNNLANALARQGKAAEAFTHYLEAIRIKSDYAEAHNGLGALQAGQGRDGDALVQYTEAVHIDPNYAEAHNNMGAVLLGQGKTGEAIREFSEAVRINPAKPEFHYNLGVALNKAGQTKEAIDQFSIAFKLKPDYKEARQALDALR